MKIRKAGDRGVFAPPASYAQERLWFLEQLEPGTPLYNIPYVISFPGPLLRAAFERAVNRLIARHESLRTCFLEEGGTPRQVIFAELSVEVDWEDLGREGDAAVAARLAARAAEVASRPFDLREAPLFRIAVVATARETAILTTIHHIIADGWSVGVFQRELSALYRQEAGGPPAALPELRLQYADYAVWQREHLAGESLERLRRYWARQLEGAPTVLELPGDRPRPPKQTFHGAVHAFEIAPGPTSTLRALRALGQRHGATLFMTLFAAFAVFLYRLTGQRDVLVGTPIAGRRSAELEHLIGLFVNTLVLRARTAPEQTFTALLEEIKAMVVDAFEHQDLPFEKLVLELGPKRDLSRGPLIQVLFTLQNMPAATPPDAAGAAATVGQGRSLDAHTGTAKFDFALFTAEVGDRLACSIEYNTDLFSAATIEDFAACYATLLGGIARDPEAQLAAYPLLDEARRRRALERGHGAAVPTLAAAPLGCHQLFEQQARRTPDAIAISHASRGADARATYAELDARANRLARHLALRGVRPGDRVGLCVPRGTGQIAAVLAIVKAGAAYVPLDPDHPLERLRFLLADAGARLLVTSAEIRAELAEPDGAVVLERDAAQIAAQPAEPLELPCSPEQPLYVLYTSGSTGRPKGVVMPHRAITNLLAWQARAAGAPPEAATLQLAPLTFDVGSQELFATLSSGGRLELVDDDVRRDAPRLLELLRRQRVERLFVPPVVLEGLARAAAAPDAAVPDALREVIVAGDRLTVTDLVRRLFARLPGARLVNQYGPTESHVVSAHVLDGPAAAWPVHPPIGAPIDGVRLYVLDERLAPVPPHVTGELYIGGAAVSLGYLNRPDETARRFVRDPFDPDGGVLYRTGDLCRADRDGVLSFIGRADQQIKLRGFRIEPGEIEVALERHARVADAAVVKRPSRAGEDQLVAYLVVDGGAGAGPDPAELRALLAAELPAYMIPAHFVPLDRFPMTSSGKIDRLALPDPLEAAASRGEAPVRIAPRTPVERLLADAWREVLGLPDVTLHDNFFELGGHSLSATQLVSRIRDRLGLELPLYRIFERPTLEALALEIVQRQAAREEGAGLEAMLDELEGMSDEEAEALLSGSRTDVP